MRTDRRFPSGSRHTYAYGPQSLAGDYSTLEPGEDALELEYRSSHKGQPPFQEERPLPLFYYRKDVNTKSYIYLEFPKSLGRRFQPFDRCLLEEQAQELFKRIQLRQDLKWPRVEEAEQPWPLGAFDPGI